jgi:hypothetical protein
MARKTIWTSPGRSSESLAAGTRTVYPNGLTDELINAWLIERRRGWPDTTNPHLFITSQSAHPRPDRP